MRVGRLGNTRIELPVDAACGYSDEQNLVVCLDDGMKLSDTDHLRLLAMSADPFELRAGSPQALSVVLDVLAVSVFRNQNSRFGVSADGCSGACERRISVRIL